MCKHREKSKDGREATNVVCTELNEGKQQMLQIILECGSEWAGTFMKTESRHCGQWENQRDNQSSANLQQLEVMRAQHERSRNTNNDLTSKWKLCSSANQKQLIWTGFDSWQGGKVSDQVTLYVGTNAVLD